MKSKLDIPVGSVWIFRSKTFTNDRGVYLILSNANGMLSYRFQRGGWVDFKNLLACLEFKGTGTVERWNELYDNGELKQFC